MALMASEPVVVEVVARYGEHVVDVQHLGPTPDETVPQPVLWLAGGCSVVLGLLLWGSGVAAVATTVATTDVTTEAEAVAADAPEAPRSTGFAGLGLVLVLLGVVPLAAAFTRPRARASDRYCIGEGPDVDLPVALPPGQDPASVPLLVALPQQVVITLFPGISGTVVVSEDHTLQLADLHAEGRRSYAVPAGARCTAVLPTTAAGPAVQVECTTVAASVWQSQRHPLDRLYVASNLGALAVALGVWMTANPPAPGELSADDLLAHRDRAVRYMERVKPPEQSQSDPPKPPPQATKTAAQAKPKPAPPPTIPELAQEDDANAQQIVPRGTRRGPRKDYDYARVAGFLNDDAGTAAAGKASADAQESALHYRDSQEMLAFWDGVKSAPVIDRPLGGLSLAETERGGGIHHDRPKPKPESGKQVVIDGLGHGPGPSAEDRALARRVVKLRFETPNVRGDLSERTVLDYIEQHAGGLRQCFKDAVGMADKVGTAILQFKISATGQTSSAKLAYTSSQLGNIGPCLAKSARAWKFTAPTDHQPVSVAIEFSFSAQSY